MDDIVDAEVVGKGHCARVVWIVGDGRRRDWLARRAARLKVNLKGNQYAGNIGKIPGGTGIFELPGQPRSDVRRFRRDSNKLTSHPTKVLLRIFGAYWLKMSNL